MSHLTAAITPAPPALSRFHAPPQPFVERHGAWILSLCLHVMVFSLLIIHKPARSPVEQPEMAIHVDLVDNSTPAGDPMGDPNGLGAIAGGGGLAATLGGAAGTAGDGAGAPVGSSGHAASAPPVQVTEAPPAQAVGADQPVARESGARTTEATPPVVAQATPPPPEEVAAEVAPTPLPALHGERPASHAVSLPPDPYADEDDPAAQAEQDAMNDLLVLERLRLTSQQVAEAEPGAAGGAAESGAGTARGGGGEGKGSGRSGVGSGGGDGLLAASAALGQNGSALVAQRINEVKIKETAKAVFDNPHPNDLFAAKGATEGVNRDLDISGVPQDEAQRVLARYGIKILAQHLNGPAASGLAGSGNARKGQGRFVNKIGKQAILVFTFGTPAVSRMMQLEEEALQQRGFAPGKARVVKVLFGVVPTTGGYDLGVKEIDIQPVAPTAPSPDSKPNSAPNPAPESAKG